MTVRQSWIRGRLAATLVLPAIVVAACGGEPTHPDGGPEDGDGALRHLELRVEGKGDSTDRERLERAGQEVVRALAEQGARSAEVVAGEPYVYVRARLEPEQERAASRLPAVRAVRRPVVVTGRVESFELGWILETGDGSRYALNWHVAQPADLRDGARLEVEGLPEQFGLFFAPGATPLLVRAVRPL